MSRLLNLYENLIKFAGLTVNNDGYVFVAINDKREPFTIDGKQVVLPTKEHLKNSVNKCIFHPLRENLMGGESEIVKAYRNALAIRFNVVSTTIGQYLLLAAASSDQHQKLSAAQLNLVTSLGDVDAKSIENYNKVVMAGMKLDPYKNFVGLFLKKGDTILGKRYARVCITTFPIYEQLVEGADKINGVKIRVKDVDAFIKLYKYMLSGIDDQHSYSAGTNSRIAPYMEALMDAGKRIASNFNDILSQYGDFIDDANSLVFNSDWANDFTNLEDINGEIIRIPSQGANQTTMVNEESEVQAPSPVVAEPRQAPVVMQPQVQHQPMPAPQVWQPPMMQQPMQQPMVQPMAAVKAPGEPMSVRELLAMSPGSNMAPNPLAPILQQGMMRQQYPQQMQPGMMPMMQQPMQQPMYPQQMQQPMMMPMMQQPMQQPMYPQQMQQPMMMPMAPQYPQQMQPGMMQPGMMQQPMYPQQMQPGVPMPNYPHPGTPAMR